MKLRVRVPKELQQYAGRFCEGIGRYALSMPDHPPAKVQGEVSFVTVHFLDQKYRDLFDDLVEAYDLSHAALVSAALSAVRERDERCGHWSKDV